MRTHDNRDASFHSTRSQAKTGELVSLPVEMYMILFRLGFFFFLVSRRAVLYVHGAKRTIACS